jgi:hypothetical protein
VRVITDIGQGTTDQERIENDARSREEQVGKRSRGQEWLTWRLLRCMFCRYTASIKTSLFFCRILTPSPLSLPQPVDAVAAVAESRRECTVGELYVEGAIIHIYLYIYSRAKFRG